MARFVVELLKTQGPNLFIFVVTMENHGPWGPGDSRGTHADPAPALPPLAGDESLKRYLNGLRAADAMIGVLRADLEANYPNGVLAFYGDHLPGLPATFAQLGFADTQTDYVIWKAGHGITQQRELAVHQLPRIVFDVSQEAETPVVWGRSE